MRTLLCTPFSLRSKTVIQKTGAKNAGDYWKQVKASRPFGDDPRKTSDGRADRCAVLGEYARRFYYQFYEKPIVNSAGKRVNEFNKMMPLTDSVNSEISALFRRISPCVQFVEIRRGMYSSITVRAVFGVCRGL